MEHTTINNTSFPLETPLSFAQRIRINEWIGAVGQDTIRKNGYVVMDSIRISKVEGTYRLERID